MGWNGDISHMGRLAENIGKLASVPSQAAADAADSIATLIEQEFDAGEDPYGNEWEPLSTATKANGRTPPPLTDTGAMRGSVRVQPMRGAGISITVDHPAAPHQTGWTGSRGTGPARPILPSYAFPRGWREALDRAVSAAAKRSQR